MILIYQMSNYFCSLGFTVKGPEILKAPNMINTSQGSFVVATLVAFYPND
jgi:hypothetical protein